MLFQNINSAAPFTCKTFYFYFSKKKYNLRLSNSHWWLLLFWLFAKNMFVNSQLIPNYLKRKTKGLKQNNLWNKILTSVGLWFESLLFIYTGKKNLHTCLFIISNVAKAHPSLRWPPHGYLLLHIIAEDIKGISSRSCQLWLCFHMLSPQMALNNSLEPK